MIKKIFNFLIVTIITLCGFVSYAVDGDYLDKELTHFVQAQAHNEGQKTCVCNSFSNEQNIDVCSALLSNVQTSSVYRTLTTNVQNIKGEELVPYYEFNLSYGGHNYKLHYDTQKDMSQNFMINEQSKKWGRDGNHKEAVFALSTLIKMGVEPEVAFNFLFPNISEKIDKILDKVNILPKDSKVLFTPNFFQKFIITQEKDGYVVNKDKLYLQLLNKFAESPQSSIILNPELTSPMVTHQDNRERTQLLSRFSTSIATSSSARQNNVKLALKQFNGMVVAPNQEISFNATTGRRTEAKGYKEAHIILDGLFVDGTGGGVCQSSSTLYNALLLADNVEILEANRHSMPVSYVKLGFDAMVAYGSSDLRFKNVGEYPIYLHTYSKDNSVYVEVYGKKIDEKIEKKRRSEVLRYIKPKDDLIKNDTDNKFSNLMNENGYYRQKKSAEGIEVQTYLDYYKNGERIDTKKIRHTTYPAQQGIVYKGKPKIVESVEDKANVVSFENVLQ